MLQWSGSHMVIKDLFQPEKQEGEGEESEENPQTQLQYNSHCAQEWLVVSK